MQFGQFKIWRRQNEVTLTYRYYSLFINRVKAKQKNLNQCLRYQSKDKSALGVHQGAVYSMCIGKLNKYML